MYSTRQLKTRLRDLNVNITLVERLLQLVSQQSSPATLYWDQEQINFPLSAYLTRYLEKKNPIVKLLHQLDVFDVHLIQTGPVLRKQDNWVFYFKKRTGVISVVKIESIQFRSPPTMAEVTAHALIDLDDNKAVDMDVAMFREIMTPAAKDSNETDAEAVKEEGELETPKPSLTLEDAPAGLKDAFIAAMTQERILEEEGREVTVAIPH